MANDNFGKLNKDQLVELQDELRRFAEGAKSAATAYNNLIAGTDASRLKADMTTATRAAENLAKATQEDLKTKEGRNKLQERYNEILKEQNAVEAKLLILKREIDLATKDQLPNLEEAYKQALNLKDQFQGMASAANQVASEVKKVAEAGEGFEKMASALSKIPIIGGALSAPLQAAAAAARKATAEGIAPGEAKLRGWLSLSKSIALTIGGAIVGALMSASQRLGDINKQLGTGLEGARATAERFEQFANASEDSRITTEKLIKANGELNAALGTTVEFSGETLANFIKTTEYMGVSVAAAAKLEVLSRTTGTSTEAFAGNLAESVSQAGKANGLFMSTSSALEKVKDLSATTLLNLRRNPEAIGQALIATEKLGISFQQLRATASSLLDFESSIQNELEAELLTGRELNLERARSAALRGDDLALTRELANQVGTLSEYEQMNVIQRESLAKAFGMTSDQMSEMLLKQELMNSLGEDARNLSAEQARNIKEMVASGEASSEQDALLKLQQQQDATKRFQDAVAKLRSAFVDFFEQFEPAFNSLVEKIKSLTESTWLKTIVGILTSGAGITAIIGSLVASKLMGTPVMPMWVRVANMGGAGTMSSNTLGGMGTGAGGSKSLTWNEYQKSMKGKGLSSSQMSAGYQAQKAAAAAPARTMRGMSAGMGAGIGMVGTLVGGAMMQSEDEDMQMYGSALSMAGTGAMIGSMIMPGIGTAIGAALGGLGGLFMASQERDRAKEEARRQTELELAAQQKDGYTRMEEHLKKLAEREAKIYMDGNDVAISTAMASPKLGN